MESTPLFASPIVKQDNQPVSDTVVFWIDTSSGTNTVKIRDNEGNWTSVVPNFPIFVTQEGVSFNESDITLSGDYIINNGAISYPTTSIGDSQSNFNGNNVDSGGYRFTPSFDNLTLEVTPYHPTRSAYSKLALRNYGGGDIETYSNVTIGDSIEFNTTLSQNTDYEVYIEQTGDTSIGSEIDINTPLTTNESIVTNGTTSTSNYIRCFSNIKLTKPNADNTIVEFSSIEDLSAWDRVSWQQKVNNGSITVNIEVNNGSGWNTLASDIASPYSIASIDPTSDIRIVFNLSYTDNEAPLISYVARRGER
jgi:hypothetical protein